MSHHCLVIVSAPCVVEIDTDGELVMPINGAEQFTTDTQNIEEDNVILNKWGNSSSSARSSLRSLDAENHLPYPSRLVDVDLGYHQDHRRDNNPDNLRLPANRSSPTDCTHQVPIREYVEQTLVNLLKQRLVVTEPRCLGDAGTNSLQVTSFRE